MIYERNRLVSSDGRENGMDGLVQRQIAAFLPKERIARLLDYGAGNSPYRHFTDCECYLTADVGQNVYGDIDHVIVAGESMSVESGSLDLVPLLDVLEHVPDPNFVLAEIRRLLVPNGRLVISVPFLSGTRNTKWVILP